MKVSLIPYDNVVDIWPKVRPCITKAAKYTFGRFDEEDILDQILEYDHLLWVAFDEEGVKGAVVTTFVHYPKIKALNMVFTGGEQLENWKEPMLELLQKFAKDKECDVIESTGRPGWAKIFSNDGHKVVWHTYELPVEASGV